MKSTEGKVRGRPSIRKRKTDNNSPSTNNASSSENENNRSILDFFSPPRTTASSQATSLNNTIDKRSGSTPRRKLNPLKNLESNLSPKYIGFSTPTSSDKRYSRYRTPKLNESGVVPTSYFNSNHGPIGCVRRTTLNGGLNSPKSSPEVSLRRNDLFESPIEKLLRKNGALKSLPNSPNCLTSPEFVENNLIKKLAEESANKKKNCVVRLEQMSHEMVGPIGCNNLVQRDIGICEMDVEPEFDASTTEHDVSGTLVQSEEMVEAAEIVTRVETSEQRAVEEDELDKNKEVAGTETGSGLELNGSVDIVNDDESLQAVVDDVVIEEVCVEKEVVAASEMIVDITADEDIVETNEDESSGKKERPPLSPPSGSTEKNDIIEIMDEETDIIEEPTKDEAPINIPDNTSQPKELPNDVPIQSNHQTEPININTDLHENNNSEQLLNNNSKFTADDIISQKSPSTCSVDSAKGSSLDNDMNWVSIETGDIFWGQIYSFAYWPCIVCPDPDGKGIRVNERNENHVMIHVRFFADNGRRSWVKRDNLMPYNGLEQFQKKQKEVEQKYGSKSHKYKMFFVSKKNAKLWNQAVREADLLETVAIEERVDLFQKLVDEVKIHNAIERKRRQSVMHSSSTSDISSMFGSNDNLYPKQTSTLKRDRSPTPTSPAFSPVTTKHSEKRIKLNHHNDDDHHSRHDRSRSSLFIDDLDMLPDEPDKPNESQTTSTELERIQNEEDIYSDSEFKKFVAAMRSFILENSKDPKLNKEFMSNVRSMWALKHITVRMQLESQTKSNGIKRLSQRIRNISIQKSLPSTPVQNHVAQQQRQQQLVKSSAEAKPKTPLNRPIDEVIDDIFQLDSKYLFRDVAKEPICVECMKSGTDLVKCSGNCQTSLHSACSAICPEEKPDTPFVHITGDLDEEPVELPPVICKSCFTDEPSKCFVCKKDSPELGDLARCNSNQCSKFYHPTCLKYWPQAKVTKSSGKLESLRCPTHVCHTCVSDDPKGKFLHIEKSKLTKCIKCPATYHMDSTCIPAGSQFLTASWIICPRHYKQQQDQLLNVNWCFICVAGGKLICCETCPTAVHAECLKIPVADEGYICEECETGRMPLYGEMVWAKFRNFRWWPSLILPPTEVPRNLANKAHNPSEFVIRFFGSNDHAWISRRRVYLYQEGDGCEPPKSQRIGLDQHYIKGVEEAKRISEIIKAKKMLQRTNDKKQRISPLPYVKIKSNRAVPPIKLLVDYEKISKCECDKNGENPCGQDSGCLNRVLYNECNPKICPAGERCQNQLFEKKDYPKVEVLYMNEKGFGLICLEPISAGTFVIEYVGEVIDDAEFRRRITQKEQERDENFYFLTLEKDYIIDAGPKGNLARFMNHSCEPNCETQKWSVNGLDRIGLFAIKDIPKNTELTFNYFWDELLGNEKKPCHCGAAKCAGVIGGKYKEPAKGLQPPQSEKIKNRRMTTTSKAKSLKTKKPKPKAKEATAKKTTKLPSKMNTSNTSMLADTTTVDDDPQQKSPSSRTTSPKNPKQHNQSATEATLNRSVTSTST